jgi:hypothetical protein
VSSESKRKVGLRYLSHRSHRIFRWREEACGGESGARRGLRHDRGRMRRVKGRKKGRRELLEKAAGDERVFIPGRGCGLADEASSDAIPEAAGGEGRSRGR